MTKRVNIQAFSAEIYRDEESAILQGSGTSQCRWAQYRKRLTIVLRERGSMKIGEALAAYRGERKIIVQERRELYRQKESLEKKINAAPGGRERYADEAATLELSINNVNERFEENLKVLDQLTEQEAAVWNAEVSRQQADVMEDAAVEMGKIMEVAHRIAKGAIVPAADEKKLLDYSFEMYQAAKSMGAMAQMQKKREKYDSLWDDEEEEKQEYDPAGKAYNAETDIGLPASATEVGVESPAQGL